MSIRILIVDDSPTVCQNLYQICELAEDFEVIGQAENGREAVTLVRDLQPDIVLMDIEMPIMDGVQATGLIAAQTPSTRVIALTTCKNDGHVLPVIKAGAYGCLPKNTPENILIEAVRAVHRGEALIDSHITARVLDELRRADEDLTPSSQRRK